MSVDLVGLVSISIDLPGLKYEKLCYIESAATSEVPWVAKSCLSQGKLARMSKVV